MSVVVDTNVIIVANDQADHASAACVNACAQRLRQIELEQSGKLVLDDDFRIIKEYQNKPLSEKQPGAGFVFLKWVLRNWANDQRCELVTITPCGLTETDFEEFPRDAALADFDPADRKAVMGVGAPS